MVNFEKNNSLEQRGKSNPFEARAVAAVIFASLGSFEAMPVQALEIQPTTSWQAGIQENIRRSVVEDKTERGTVYVAFVDGTGAWLSPSAGKAQEVSFSSAELKSQIEKIRGGKKILATCLIHTHPSEIYRKQLNGPGEAEQIPIPPSSDDIITAGQARRALVSGDMNPKQVRFAAADAKYVWYFSQGQNQKVDPVKFKVAYKDFVIKSMDSGFDFNKELPKLQEAYRNYLGGEIRAVAYENLKNEPPCAGTDVK